jgi:hypothetical protein
MRADNIRPCTGPARVHCCKTLTVWSYRHDKKGQGMDYIKRVSRKYSPNHCILSQSHNKGIFPQKQPKICCLICSVQYILVFEMAKTQCPAVDCCSIPSSPGSPNETLPELNNGLHTLVYLFGWTASLGQASNPMDKRHGPPPSGGIR